MSQELGYTIDSIYERIAFLSEACDGMASNLEGCEAPLDALRGLAGTLRDLTLQIKPFVGGDENLPLQVAHYKAGVSQDLFDVEAQRVIDALKAKRGGAR